MAVVSRFVLRRAAMVIPILIGVSIVVFITLKMIPGEVRDTGNTWEADLLVVRPGAQSQHIDATFRVEAGKITAINIAPR